MRLNHKIFLIVTICILFTAGIGLILIYNYAKQEVMEQQANHLTIQAKNLIEPFNKRFLYSRVKLPELARLIQEELSKPFSQQDLDAFYRSMLKDEDGVWRNRKPPYDGQKEAGIFLPANANESELQKLRHWRIKKVIDTFGAAAAFKIENVWYLSPNRSEIIYDRNLPDFTINMLPDNDYTSTPWVTYTSPELNPQRIMRYTPPLYDPVAEAWMVSAIYPLYLEDEWLGTIGEDMQLTNVIGSSLKSSQLYSNTQHFMIDDAENFVLAGKQQKKLESNQQNFVTDFSTSPQLKALFSRKLSETPEILEESTTINGQRHIAIGMRLEPLGWRYFELVPIAEIMAKTQQFFVSLIVMILVIFIVSAIAIKFWMNRQILKPLHLLTDKLGRFGKGEKVSFSKLQKNNDEISQMATAFNEMADRISRSIQEQSDSELVLRDSEERWKFALEGAGDGVWDWSVQTEEALFSARWKEIVGYQDDEFPNQSDAWIEHIHPDDKEEVFARLQDYFDGKLPIYEVKYRMRCKDGRYKWILSRGKVISRDDNGKPLRMIGTHTDIDIEKKHEEELELAAMVYQISSESMLVTDADNRIVAVNNAFTTTTGYTAEEVIGKDPNILSSGRQGEAFYQEMWDQLKTTGSWQGEYWNRRKNGESYAVFTVINTLYHLNGEVYRRVALSSDITNKKKTEEIIWKQANYDFLTGLPNRNMFLDRLSVEIKKAQRDRNSLAILFIDLDRFKEVNDNLGHHMGDDLLVQTSERLLSLVRETDTVARMGGDEFTVILSELQDPSHVGSLAKNMIDKLHKPYHLGEDVVHVSASIGITLYPDDSKNLDQLLQNADQAMYSAKSLGRNRYSYFTPELQESSIQRMRMIEDLNSALPLKQLSVYYQPIVELATGQIRKAEALLRWNHPTQGFIGPMTFIPLAEETELIIPIGDWVFHESARCAKQWGELMPGGIFQISVNKSPIQFRREEKTEEKWVNHLKKIGLTGDSITVEITEGLLLNRDDITASKLLEFRDAGIQVSMDDFGTGYSSLSYLKKFDIDYLKIDQSFVKNITQDIADVVLCEAIIAMAHKLGLKVIAEGVETQQQHDILKEMGCDFGQGYLFARPLPEDEFDALIRRKATNEV